MHTISLTGSISIGAPPEAVISLLGDPPRLPSWAPAFARRVLPDGGRWIVEAADGTRTPVTFRISPEHGTVDVLVTQAPPRGAYLRVLGHGRGSELVLTVIVPDPGDPAAAARQQQALDDELRAARDLAEGAQADPTAGGPPGRGGALATRSVPCERRAR